jgi:hypothetical protein
MITRVDARFCQEAVLFKLQCTCSSCAAFDEEASACAYGYPVEPHRRLPLTGETEFVFCKAFELA